jgi:hypothetical protein
MRTSRHWGRARLALALSVAVSALSATGFAQEDFRAPASNGGGVDTHLFRPALDSKGFFTVNGSDILGADDISFGLVLDYGHNIMRTVDSSVPPGCDDGECEDAMGNPILPTGNGRGVEALVANSFQGTWAFNYGIANMAEVGLTVPVVLMTGNEAYNVGPAGAPYNTVALDEQSINTVALHGKLRLTRVEKGIGLAVALQAGIPLGDASRNLGGEPGVWYWPRVIAENRFGATGRLKIGVDVGYRGHQGNNSAFTSGALEEGAFEYSDLLTFGGAISWRALDSLDLIAETYGTMQSEASSF